MVKSSEVGKKNKQTWIQGKVYLSLTNQQPTTYIYNPATQAFSYSKSSNCITCLKQLGMPSFTSYSAMHVFPWCWLIAAVLNQCSSSVWRRKTERPWRNGQIDMRPGRQKDRERNRNEQRQGKMQRKNRGGGGRGTERMSKQVGKGERGPHWAVAVEWIYLSCGLSSESPEWE